MSRFRKKESLDDLISESQRIRDELIKTASKLEVFTALLAEEVATLADEAGHLGDDDSHE